MIVEVFGVDGSGKTTLIRNAKKVVDGWSGHWAYERNFRNRSRLLLEAIALRAGRQRAEDLYSEQALRLSDALAVLDEATRHLHFDVATSGQVYLVDHYHAGWLARALRGGPAALAELAPIYSHLPRPALSFWLRLDPAEALRRLAGRPGGDQLLQKQDPLEALTAADRDFEMVLPALPYTVERLDGARAPEDLATHVLDRIASAGGR